MSKDAACGVVPALAMRQANEAMPERWYERNGIATVCVTLGAGVLEAAMDSQFHFPNVLEHAGVAGFYIAAATADNISTRKTFKGADRAKELGVGGLNESNIFMQNATTLEEYDQAKRRPKVRLTEAAVFAGVALLPTVGSIVGTGRFLATANNRRRAKRQALEIAIMENSIDS